MFHPYPHLRTFWYPSFAREPPKLFAIRPRRVDKPRKRRTACRQQIPAGSGATRHRSHHPAVTCDSYRSMSRKAAWAREPRRSSRGRQPFSKLSPVSILCRLQPEALPASIERAVSRHTLQTINRRCKTNRLTPTPQSPTTPVPNQLVSRVATPQARLPLPLLRSRRALGTLPSVTVTQSCCTQSSARFGSPAARWTPRSPDPPVGTPTLSPHFRRFGQNGH